MQLMPRTAARLGVGDRCNSNQNIAGGIRYLAWLIEQFHDLRLVTAAYYAVEGVIAKRGFSYRNPEVLAYVSKLRQLYLRQASVEASNTNPNLERDVR
jgi:soluble lytic murein transglycosylase-like protein